MTNNKIIYIISFFSGFLSLAQEIIWMRLISFVGMSVPQTFSYTLALFLIGIAIGAQIGKKICKTNQNVKLNLLGQIFFIAALTDILLILLVYAYSYFFSPSILVLGLCVVICAAVRGIIFPMVHHVGTATSKTGAQISNVYFCNVFGSALAPLLISFVALDYLNTQQVYLFICLMTLVTACLCIDDKKIKLIYVVFMIFPVFLMTLPEKLFHEFSKNSYQENTYPSLLLENKHGIIQVYDDKKDKIVFGANVYDGKLNTNIFHNSNGIDRAFLLTALKPQAEHVLVIGLSTGSWAKVLSLMPNIKKMTIIEINPNYIELIKMYPEVRGILDDPRIEIVIDDGRKWLKKNDQKKFDIILMNTTWHWRAYGSNLLSQNFIQIIHDRLNKTGLAFYNTTQSMNAYVTAHQVFPYVYQYKFFILGANQPQQVNFNQIKNNLCLLKDPLTKSAVFSNEAQCQKAAEVITENTLIPYEVIKFNQKNKDLEVITDDNMITEFKYGKGL
ncbi:spermidine synthase [Acinetobacter sp. ANC 3781]|uniref:fused MFS/spermidine synthase n=1 Tax=Acinetobacter sp. ANC 3781 TaxID=2529835 RepID=UPI00103C70AF|nr:fused MFS/spermidine synthase [Acinetobacter sp. ANC 3781]TCB75096.1 spermidine synthase [Acinetobacter sp. ANC 3781]